MSHIYLVIYLLGFTGGTAGPFPDMNSCKQAIVDMGTPDESKAHQTKTHGVVHASDFKFVCEEVSARPEITYKD
jgi:hypothetical protein